MVPRDLFDLLPAFLEVSKANSNKVFVIDEVDRSLHTLLTRQLLGILPNPMQPVTVAGPSYFSQRMMYC